MDRLRTRILVFCGLLGIAGLLFGVPESHVFLPTRLILPEAEQSLPWFVLLAFPLSLALVIFSIWLAGRWATGSPRLGLRTVAAAHFPLVYGAIWIGIAFVVSLGDSTFTSGTIIGVLGILVAVNLVELVRQGRLAKHRTPEQKAQSKRLARPTMMVGIPLFVVAGIIVYLIEKDACGRSWELYGISSMCGFSLPMAAQLGGVGQIHFARWLMYAVCIGGALGVFTGVMFTMGSEGDLRGRMVRRSWIGAALGAVCSGVMFGAHSVLLMQSYRVAWNSHDVLTSSLWTWCVTGLLGGLMLAGATHVMSTPPENRLDRIRSLVPLVALPMIILSLWAHGFVRKYDAGRHLLVEASRLEGQCWWIKIDMLAEDKMTPPGNSVIQIHSDGRLTRDVQDGRYDQTISLCDRLIREYPESAFHSGAIYLKYLAHSGNWRPNEALAALGTLDRAYPRQGYTKWSPMFEAGNRMLAGDYEQVLRLYRTDESSPDARHRGGGREYRAACVLGRWDDAIGVCLTVIADTERDVRDKVVNPAPLRVWKKRLACAESMKARGVGPTPRYDVSGRLTLDGKPIPGTRVCLLPSDTGPSDKPITSPHAASLIGGVLGSADVKGVYRIKGVPVGEYEILIVTPPGRVPAKVRTDGLEAPLMVTGASTDLPEIRLRSPDP